MNLGEALKKSKIAMLKMKDKVFLVTATAAYEAPIKWKVGGASIFKTFKVMDKFNTIPASDKWEALGYHEE